MATTDDVLRAQQDTNDLLRELINNFSSAGSGGGPGVGPSRRRSSGRHSGGPDPYGDIRYRQDEGPKSLEELIEQYERIEELEIDRFKRMKEQKEAAEEFFEIHKDELDEIFEKKSRNEELTEREIELMREATDAARENGEAMGYLSNHTRLGAFTKTLGSIGNTLKGMYDEVHKLGEPWREIDAAASKYAKTIGLTSRAMKQLAEDTNRNVVNNDIALRYNVDSKELLAAQENYMKAAGRNIRVSDSEQETIAAMTLMGGKGNELAAMFDNFGVSLETTGDHVGKMFADATKQGLSFEKYSDNVAKNIKLAQNYTFKNGLKGLESMAKKATAMKMDMQQVAALADKVSTVEGAIDVSSQLQVLGGPFAQLADPLGMLNEGLNDMEGLQDRLIKMVGGLGSFDKETGEVKVSSFNKQRIKAASQAMGVDYGTIMESVNAQARRGEISKQIAASEVASGFDDDMKELIMNSGTIKNGKAGVSIRGQFKALDDITEEDRKAIEKESQVESEDIKDIAFSTRSLNEIEEGVKKDHREQQAQFYKDLAETMAGITTKLGGIDKIHKLLIIMQTAQVVGSVMDMGKGLFNKGKNLVKSLFGKGKVGGSANTIGGKVKNLWNGAKNLFGGGSSAGGSASTIGGKGGSTISKAWNSVKNIFSGGGSTAGGSASTIGGKGSLIDDLFAKGKNFFDGAFKQGSGILNNIMKSGKSFVSKILGGGKSVLGNLLSKGKGLISNLMKNGNGLISNLLSKGKGLINSLLSSGKNLLSRLFSGGGGGGGGNLISRAFNGIKNFLKGGKISKIWKGAKGVVGKVWNGAKNIFKGGGSSIVKGGVGRTLKRAGLKVFGKTVMKGAAKLGGKLLTGVAKGGPLGIIGAVGDIATDALLANGKIKEGGAAHKALSTGSGAASGAAMGAMIGSIIPGVGTLIGGAVGGLIGGINGFFKANKKKVKKFEAKSKKSAAEILQGYSTKVKPILEKGNNAKYGAVNKANNDVHLKTDPHDIKINGTLNIKGQDGKTIDLVSELRNNPHMLRQVSDMISNEMGVLQKGANVVQRA